MSGACPAPQHFQLWAAKRDRAKIFRFVWRSATPIPPNRGFHRKKSSISPLNICPQVPPICPQVLQICPMCHRSCQVAEAGRAAQRAEAGSWRMAHTKVRPPTLRSEPGSSPALPPLGDPSPPRCAPRGCFAKGRGRLFTHKHVRQKRDVGAKSAPTRSQTRSVALPIARSIVWAGLRSGAGGVLVIGRAWVRACLRRRLRPCRRTFPARIRGQLSIYRRGSAGPSRAVRFP